MIMLPEEIKTLIEQGITTTSGVTPTVYVEGDGAHFTAIVVSDCFIGKSRLQKQQLVNDTVRKQLLDGSLHALSIKTFTTLEWQAINQNGT